MDESGGGVADGENRFCSSDSNRHHRSATWGWRESRGKFAGQNVPIKVQTTTGRVFHLWESIRPVN